MARATAILAAATACIALATPMPGTAAAPRDCGDLTIGPARQGAGLGAGGVFDVITFSRDQHMPAPGCRSAMQWSRAYVDERTVPRGFKVKAIRGTVGRAFLRIGNEDVGFRVVLRR